MGLTIYSDPMPSHANITPLPHFDIREVFPYLSAFREQYVVLTIAASSLLDERAPLVEDLLMLAFSGIKIILVPDHEDFLQAQSVAWQLTRHPQNGQWIIPHEAWHLVASTLSLRHFQIQGALSRQIRRQDLHRQSADIHAGAYVVSRARGIYSGLDLGRHGAVRHVDQPLLHNHLQKGGIALVSALAPSATGNLYWIPAESLSASICLGIKALKWLRLVDTNLHEYIPLEAVTQLSQEQGVSFKKPLTSREGLPAEVTTSAIRSILLNKSSIHHGDALGRARDFWERACQVADQGKGRVHLIRCDGHEHRNNLLTELFTHHGSGIMLCPTMLESIRPATVEDVGGILALIAPLEEDGTLVPRSRDQIERDIRHFWVAEHDKRLIGCAALLPMTLMESHVGNPASKAVELACMAIAVEEQRRGLGGELLETLIEHGEKEGISQIFLLTSRTHEWFSEYGFRAVTPDALPADRRAHYDTGRCSRVMMLDL